MHKIIFILLVLNKKMEFFKVDIKEFFELK